MSNGGHFTDMKKSLLSGLLGLFSNPSPLFYNLTNIFSRQKKDNIVPLYIVLLCLCEILIVENPFFLVSLVVPVFPVHKMDVKILKCVIFRAT